MTVDLPSDRYQESPTTLSPITSRLWAAIEPRPVAMTPIIGRDRDIGAICDMLEQDGVRLITLTGPGGVGKTRLSLAVANALHDRYSDAIAFVDLVTIREVAQISSAIAHALGLWDAQAEFNVDALSAVIRDRSLLLVVDNFEHVIDAAPSIINLLVACPQLKVLATSRSPLQVRGERRYPVAPLVVPEQSESTSLHDALNSGAVQLFADRARAIEPTFQLTESNASVVIEICRALDGLPLAIELAASRVHQMSLSTLQTRLHGGLSLLSHGARDLPIRQRTLRDAIAWSYDLLTPSERTLFRRLAIFLDSFSLEAVERVCSTIETTEGENSLPSDDVLDGIAALIEHSLLQFHQSDAGVERGPRYRMLETIREFATERLFAEDDAEEIRRRHAYWCVSFAEAARSSFYTSNEATVMNQLEADYANLRAGLTWFDDHRELELGARLAAALAWFWHSRGPAKEGANWLGRFAESDQGIAPAIYADVLTGSGFLAWTVADFDRAEREINVAIELWRQLGHSAGLVRALNFQSLVASAKHQPNIQYDTIAEATVLAREVADPLWIALSVGSLGHARAQLGDSTGALAALEEDLSLLRGVGYERGMGWALEGLGDVAMSIGDSKRAEAHYREALALSWKHRARSTFVHELRRLATALAANGDSERSVSLLGTVAAVWEAIGASPAKDDAFDNQELLDALRDQLGATRFDDVWTTGYSMPLDHAIETALEPPVAVPPEQSQLPNSPLLTQREREILPLLIAGKTDREIAETLFIGRRTVESHVARLIAKLGVSTRTAAANAARAAGLDESTSLH